GIKVAAKIIAKETGENIAQSAASETVSGAIGKPLPLWAEISLGVVVGIKPKDIGKKGKSGIKEGADEAGDAAAGKFTKGKYESNAKHGDKKRGNVGKEPTNPE